MNNAAINAIEVTTEYARVYVEGENQEGVLYRNLQLAKEKARLARDLLCHTNLVVKIRRECVVSMQPATPEDHDALDNFYELRSQDLAAGAYDEMGILPEPKFNVVGTEFQPLV